MIELQCTFSVINGSLEKKPGIKNSKSKMFERIDDSWNPVVGCLHDCCYCWAKMLATTKLKNIERYKDGFVPKLVEKEFKKRFKNKFIFVTDMGDLFGKWVPSKWIRRVIDTIKLSPTTDFLFLTKNPGRYFEFIEEYPKNVVLGATIETNAPFKVAKAPSVKKRYLAMTKLPWDKKLISVEPIMDFNLPRFLDWFKEINPNIVYVGYDNYQNKLDEPSKEKTLDLIEQLRSFTTVRKKTIREAWG